MVTQVVSIPLSKIRPNPNNPRKVVTPEAVDKCAASLKAVGQKTPIKVRALPDGNFELVGGHIRLEAAKKLGWEALDGIIRDIPSDQAFLESILDNRDEEMTWLEWYEAIENLMNQPPKKTQQELADLLGISQFTVSREVNLLKALNKAAREAIYRNPINSSIIPENTVFPLCGLLDIPGKTQDDLLVLVERALAVVIDRKMNEPEVARYVAWIKKGGYPSKYPMKGSTDSIRSAPSPQARNDPNWELWKPMPEWTGVKPDKEGSYDFRGKLDKFGGPYGIYCLLSGMMKYFQRVEKVRNPAVEIPNPYEAKLEELLEKGVREALENSAQEQKAYDEKVARKKSKVQPKGTKPADQPVKETPLITTPEPLSKNKGGPAALPTEEEMKPLMDLLGNPDLKDNLKKMFGDLFNK